MAKEKTPAQLLRDSFGEVYTKLPLVEEMIDQIPDAVMVNPKSKILDNSCGGGNFAVAVYNRLMTTIDIPNEAERKKHILENMLYFTDIQSKNLYFTMNRLDGNSEERYDFNYDIGDSLTLDYDALGLFADAYKIVTIGNPPYNAQRNVNNSSISIYHNFVDKAYEISDIVIMVTPSRWFQQNSQGMKEFRGRMCDYGITTLQSIDTMKEFNLSIKGGCSYFVIEKGYVGDANFNGTQINLRNVNTLLNLLSDVDLSKVTIPDKCITELYHSKGTFDIRSNDKRFGTGKLVCKVSKQKGDWTTITKIDDNKKEYLNKWKISFPAAMGKGGDIYKESNIVIIKPNQVVSESFIFFEAESEEHATLLKKWFMLEENLELFRIKKIKQDLTSETFSLIPMMPSDFV